MRADTLPASCYLSLVRVHQIMWAMTYVMVNYLSTILAFFFSLPVLSKYLSLI